MDSLSGIMPYLASKPNGSWITFDNAFLSTPLCCPSRATILSGQYSHHTGVTDNTKTPPTFNDRDTLPTWLKASGYTTGLFGKYLNGYPWTLAPSYIPPGWDDWFAFSQSSGYFNYTVNDNGVLKLYGKRQADYSTNVTANQAISFIQNSGTTPFFVDWTPHAPHAKFTPQSKYATLYAGTTPPHSPNFNEADVSDKPAWIRSRPLLTDSDIATTDANRLNSWRTLRSVDDDIRKLMAVLKQTGKLNNTVIIFMTDNGYSWGSHRWMTKQCEWEECIRTPMMIRYPRAANQNLKQLVSNIDIAATIDALTGSSATIPQDGTSLVPLLKGQVTGWRDQLFFESAGGADGEVPSPIHMPPWRAVRTADYKYVELAVTGEKELYDLTADPYELNNVINQPAYAAVQADMAARLATWTN